ncbi:MAG: biopolymer transporter Tol [Microcoleaceae cyanobacterium]
MQIKTFPTLSIFRWLNLYTIGFSISSLLISCNTYNRLDVNMALNSLYTDEQPALSGNGRFLAFVSNRNGKRNILLYDLQQRRFVDIQRLNRRDAIAESPSISNNAHYIVYTASDSGRPEIELYDRLTNRWEVITLGYRGWLINHSIRY